MRRYTNDGTTPPIDDSTLQSRFTQQPIVSQSNVLGGGYGGIGTSNSSKNLNQTMNSSNLPPHQRSTVTLHQHMPPYKQS